MRSRVLILVGALAALGGAARATAQVVTGTTSVDPDRAGLDELLGHPFSVAADRMEASPKRGEYRATGNVRIRRPGAALYADEVIFREAEGVAYASGHVVAVDGANVLTCERVSMRLPELYGGLERAELRIKDVESRRELEALHAGELRRAGRDELIVQAERLERTSKKQIEVEGASFTACDCGEGEAPSWRIWSKGASIDLSSGAWLFLPVFYIAEVPVLALPAFYVPLGERRSGVLAPRFGYVSNIGFRLGLPYYLALGRSWDLTLEPYYLSERGGGLDGELRYATSTRTRGEWRPSLVADFGRFDSSTGDWSKSSELSLRWALAGRHTSHFSQAGLHAEMNALGDPVYQGDFANEFLSRQAELSRSRATYHYRLEDRLRVSVGAQLMQDLRADAYAGSVEGGFRAVRLFSEQLSSRDVTGAFTGAGAVRYRFVDLVMDAAPTDLWPEIGLLAEARLAVSAFGAPRPELARFARADFRPVLSAAIDLPLGLVLEPMLIGRFTAWAGRGSGESFDATRLAGLARNRLSVDLLRDFGSVVHRVRPAMEHVILPGFVGADAAPVAADTQDEVDALGAMHQVRARLETELLDSGSGERLGALDLWIGRDLPFAGRRGTTSELVGRAEIRSPRSWPFRVDVSGMTALRLASPIPTVTNPARDVSPVVTEARVKARLADQRGDSLSVTWGRFDAARPDYMALGFEELVPSGEVPVEQYLPYADWAALPASPDPERDVASGVLRRDARPWSAFSGLNVSARARPFEPLTLGFDITLSFDDPALVERLYGAEGTPSVVRNTRALVGWASTCDCWSAYVTVSTARDREGVQVDFGVDLARLGSVSP